MGSWKSDGQDMNNPVMDARRSGFNSVPLPHLPPPPLPPPTALYFKKQILFGAAWRKKKIYLFKGQMNTDDVLMHNSGVERQGGRRGDGFNRRGCFWTANGGNSSVGCRQKATTIVKEEGKGGRECVSGGSEGKVFLS